MEDFEKTVDGVSRRGNFEEAVQRAIGKLPPDVVFKVQSCRRKDGMVRVTLGYANIFYKGGEGDTDNWDE